MKKWIGYLLVLLIGLGSAYAVGESGHVVPNGKGGCCTSVVVDHD